MDFIVENPYYDSWKHALWYYEKLGWNVLPSSPTGERRMPLIKWRTGRKDYVKEKMTGVEVVKLFKRFPGCDIQLVCGKVSRVVVVDVDSEDVPDFLMAMKTWIVKTRRGYHFYFYLKESGEDVFSFRVGEAVEVKGEGSLVTLPMSRHIKDRSFVYRWVYPPWNIKKKDFNPIVGFDEVKPYLISHLGVRGDDDVLKEVLLRMRDGFREGERNVSLTKIAGFLLYRGMDVEEVFQVLCRINRYNKPPLPERELKEIVKSLYRKNERVKSLFFPVIEKFLEKISSNGISDKLQKEVEQLIMDLKERGLDERSIIFCLKRVSLMDVIKRLNKEGGGDGREKEGQVSCDCSSE